MIPFKWWIFLAFTFVFATIFSSLLEASMVGDIGLTPIGEIINGIPFTSIGTSSGDIAGAAFSGSFWSGMGDVLSWNYSFFNGSLYGFPLVFFRICGLAITAVMVLNLGLTLLNGLKGVL